MYTVIRRLPLLLAALLILGGTSLAHAEVAKPTARRCITVLYPNGPDVKFDFDYYKEKHAPLIRRLYGKGIAKIELRRGVATQDGSPLPYVAVINIWIGSQTAFDAAAKLHAAELIADVPNFTNGKPVIQIDEIVD